MTKDTREKWAGRIREWQASGLSAEEFASGKDFEGSSLRWAASQLRETQKMQTAQRPKARRVAASLTVTPRLLPVRMYRPAPVATAGIVIEVSGAQIRVTREADLTLVGDVVRALQGVVR